VLVYPARQPEVARPAPGRVVALLGRTRAGVLHSVRAPSTTGEIARRLLVSAATASEHMTVLRDAGLVTSQRYANSVLHALTPLGSALLNGA
jgi:DNA-binding transcriptional ArsR family regulator